MKSNNFFVPVPRYSLIIQFFRYTSCTAETIKQTRSLYKITLSLPFSKRYPKFSTPSYRTFSIMTFQKVFPMQFTLNFTTNTIVYFQSTTMSLHIFISSINFFLLYFAAFFALNFLWKEKAADFFLLFVFGI